MTGASGASPPDEPTTMSLVNYSLDVSHLTTDPGPYIPCEKCGRGLMDGQQLYIHVENDNPKWPLCEGCVELLYGSVAAFGAANDGPSDKAMLGTLDTERHRLCDLVML